MQLNTDVLNALYTLKRNHPEIVFTKNKFDKSGRMIVELPGAYFKKVTEPDIPKFLKKPT